MRVVINYNYKHDSRPEKEDYIPTYPEGQIDPNNRVLVEHTRRSCDPFQPGQIVSLEEISKVNINNPILLTTEEPFAFDGIESLGYKIQPQKDGFYI